MDDFVSEFEASFERLTGPNLKQRFFDRFYEKFTSSHTDIAGLFAKTDMKRQKEMLYDSLSAMRIFFLERKPTSAIVHLARVHGPRGLNVSAEMFEAWLEALLSSVQDLDPEYSEDVGLAWRLVLSPGITFMKSVCDH